MNCVCLIHPLFRTRFRSRDAGYPAPPALPRTRGIPASGSSVQGARTSLRPTGFSVYALPVLFANVPVDSATGARPDTDGWLILTRQGLSPRKICRALLGAIKAKLSGWRPMTEPARRTKPKTSNDSKKAPQADIPLEPLVRLSTASG